MDSYVVRIYRREGKRARILIGTVEVAGTGKKSAFANLDELGEILRRRKGRDRFSLQDRRQGLRKEVMRETPGPGPQGSAEGVRPIKPTFGR